MTPRSEVQFLGKIVNILSNIAENLLLIKTKHHNLNNRNPIILRWPLGLWASCYQSLHTLDIWPMVKTYSQIIVKIIWNKYCLYIGKKPVDQGEVDSGFRSGTIFYVILFSYLILLYVNWTGIKTTQISWTLAFCISSIQKLRRWQSEYMSIRAYILRSRYFWEYHPLALWTVAKFYTCPRGGGAVGWIVAPQAEGWLFKSQPRHT